MAGQGDYSKLDNMPGFDLISFRLIFLPYVCSVPAGYNPQALVLTNLYLGLTSIAPTQIIATGQRGCFAPSLGDVLCRDCVSSLALSHVS